jgi:hypothetical protein
MHPGAEQIGCSVDLDDPRAGAPELLGDRLRQRIVAGDDDLAMHDLAHLAGSRLAGTVCNMADRDIWPLDYVVRHR